MSQRAEPDDTTVSIDPVVQLDEASPRPQRLSHRGLAAALLVLILVVAITSVGLILRLREGAPSALATSGGHQETGPMVPQIPQVAGSQPPFMPDTPGPDKPAVPSAALIPFPKSLDSQPGMLRHSGGPYVGAAEVRAKTAQRLNCGSTDPVRRCDEVIVKFFPRYEDATTAHPTGGAFASGLAGDREVFLVTVKGQLDMTGTIRGARASFHRGPIIVSHWNYTVDATTGNIISGGTAGDVLSTSG